MYRNDVTVTDLSTFQYLELEPTSVPPETVWPGNETHLVLPDSGSELVRNETQPVIGIEIPTVDTIAVVRHGRNLGMFSLGALNIHRIGKRGAIPRITPVTAGNKLTVDDIRQLSYGYNIDRREQDPCLELSLKRKQLLVKWLGLPALMYADEPLTARPLTVRYNYRPVLM